MKTILSKILFFCLLTANPLHAKALCNRVYSVGTNTDAVSKDKAGANLISIEIFNELKKRLDCVYNERVISFSRAAEDLRNNRIDIFAFSFTNESWSKFATSIPIYSVNRLLLVQNKFYKPGAKVADYLKDSKVNFAMLSGGSFFSSSVEIAALQKAHRATFVAFPDGVMDLLSKGKVQAAFTSPIFLRRYAIQYKIKEKTMVVADDSKRLELAIFFSKKRMKPLELKMFEKVIQDMKTDGTLKKIILKYVPEEDFNSYYHF
ncbi:transporter substrate-binding domain-containing protein [Bdellovibrio svalbardensis]|uniref:Transporter substrate-binding domain-containing protein n=1 Tax=Bdellovibrio svalbardensis TaxID=2972972 RepID=A0ABT6DFY5_9BACT|nr:transporter substrate-binding domain-containing protein [Bdellovibrio svalbardensis]MDG0815759.1 transporter substrate-binding domain-containing protein [Bdellovibrio svalbardensis]